MSCFRIHSELKEKNDAEIGLEYSISLSERSPVVLNLVFILTQIHYDVLTNLLDETRMEEKRNLHEVTKYLHKEHIKTKSGTYYHIKEN